MSRGPKDAVAQFIFKAIHHRQHGNQRGDAQADAKHGDQRAKGHEAVAPFGAGVAQRNETFDWIEHG
jgi:hypothetical protein